MDRGTVVARRGSQVMSWVMHKEFTSIFIGDNGKFGFPFGNRQVSAGLLFTFW